MTHILRIWQSKLTSIYKLRFGKASQKCLQICSFNYYYRTTYKKVSTFLEREFSLQEVKYIALTVGEVFDRIQPLCGGFLMVPSLKLL